MAQNTQATMAPVTGAHSKEFLLGLYRALFTIRTFEQRCIKLYREGLIRGYFHPYLGEEAIAVGVCAALEERDYIVSTHRGHGHCIARGAEVKRMVAEVLGKRDGYCLGLGGSMHIADVSTGNLGANGIVAGGIAMGVGAAMGASIRGEDRVCAIFFSDGASNNGVFAESLNLAAAMKAPVVFVLENNHFAVCTPVEKSCAADDLYTIGEGFGVASSVVDGNDVLAVHGAMSDAVVQCRGGNGPVLIEAKTYRHGGHHVNDPGTYMPQERLDHYKAHDPVAIGKQYAIERGLATSDELAAVEKAVEDEMDEAVAFAKQSPELPIEEFHNMVENY
jgi:acetoin:2,6-dichlorophenolindophenol oxidoreductase subunit alpha